MKTFKEVVNESINKSYAVEIHGSINRYSKEQKDFVGAITFDNFDEMFKSEELVELFPASRYDVYVNFRYKTADIACKY